MNPHLGPASATSSGLWAQSGGGIGVLVTGKAVRRFLTCCASLHLIPLPAALSTRFWSEGLCVGQAHRCTRLHSFVQCSRSPQGTEVRERSS